MRDFALLEILNLVINYDFFFIIMIILVINNILFYKLVSKHNSD